MNPAPSTLAEKFVLNATVSYADVDRDEVLLLPSIFTLLQEAAIAHANQFDLGTRAMVTRGESWVLNRMAVAIDRYPRHDESLRIETWSRGINGFKGYREFRMYGAAADTVVSGSSLWLYVNVNSGSIVRVPREIAAGFPSHAGDAFCPELGSWDLGAPPASSNPTQAITLRYSDIDSNRHLNNTAYLDFVQTALAFAGHPARPRRVRIKFAKSVPADAASVNVRLEGRAAGVVAFSVECGEISCATGDMSS